ncbi:MAG: hypothetical protein JWQ74_182 [Marmoricola sp.]|nr:hypothetical protein [Marmoricola sp.]
MHDPLRSLRSPLAAVLLAVAVLVAAVLGAAPATAADEAGSSTISNAVLRWGMSNEANNAAHAPGTTNFFSAGKIPDPGKGNVKLPQASWNQSAGNVAIEKWDGAAYQPATWAGLSTDASGAAITSPSSGRYSGHQLVFSAGAGTLNRDAGTAHIAWDGDVSVLFYSGYSFFYLSDPVLDVADGKGTLKATASGFGTSQADPTLWTAIAPATVTLATLPEVDLDDAAGFNTIPAYDGVKVSSAGSSYTGSFPQSFIDFLTDAGTAPFWFNSGSSTDPAKKALPVTVSYDASAPVKPVDPADPDPVDPIDNEAPDPPKTIVKTITNTITRTVTVPGTPVVVPAAAAPAPVATAQVAAVAPLTSSATVQLLSAPRAAASPDSFRAGWWIGGVLLALAALVLAGALISPSPSSRRIG